MPSPPGRCRKRWVPPARGSTEAPPRAPGGCAGPGGRGLGAPPARARLRPGRPGGSGEGHGGAPGSGASRPAPPSCAPPPEGPRLERGVSARRGRLSALKCPAELGGGAARPRVRPGRGGSGARLPRARRLRAAAMAASCAPRRGEVGVFRTCA